MLVVGLTGNYGMGKTLVLDAFRKLGAFTVDADRLVGELLQEPDVLERLRPILGDRCFDEGGKILKGAVSDLIFRDESVRLQVEDVLHPRVFDRTDDMLLKAKADIAVIEAPLLFERGYEKRFSKIVTIYTDEETALERLEKTGIDRQDAMRRLLCQMPVKEKVRRSDYAIDNGGTVEETEAQVKNIYDELKSLARAGKA